MRDEWERKRDAELFADGERLMARLNARQAQKRAKADGGAGNALVKDGAAPAWRDGPSGTLEMSLGVRSTGRLIHGIASSSTINSHGYALRSAGAEMTLPLPLFSQHEMHKPFGEVFFARKSESRLYVRAEVFDTIAGNHAWDLIKSGETRCFSTGSKSLETAVVDGKKFVDAWTLDEVSICRRGANPDCKFDVFEPGDDGLYWLLEPEPQTKAVPEIRYSGIWSKDAIYRPGSFVTHAGSLWHSNSESKGMRPGDGSGCWTLAVKRGDAPRLESK